MHKTWYGSSSIQKFKAGLYYYHNLQYMHRCIHTHTHTYLVLIILTVECRAPQFTCDNCNVNVNYSSTLEGSTLHFSCVEGYLPSDVFIATCHPNGSWVPDPTSHMCTSASTVASGKTHDA